MEEKKKTYLDKLVPTGRDDGGLRLTWRESHGGDPVGVGVKGLNTLSNGVPDLDGLVSGSRNNLSRVLGNRNGQNVTVVSNKSSGALTVLQVPQTQSLVP